MENTKFPTNERKKKAMMLLREKDKVETAIKELEEKQAQDYKNVNGHVYSWHNQYLLSMLGAFPGEYGTANQLRQQRRKIKKGEHGFPIMYPIPFKKKIEKETGKNENEGNFAFRWAYVFGEYQVEKI